MKDVLLDFYERELEFIREEGREFARRFPKIAARLRLSDAETIEDPHVGRLIEAFALLCARLRIKMEDEFPEICQTVLQALYPQYVAPVPPISICQLWLSDMSLDIPYGRTYHRGDRLESEQIDGVQCEFRLCYDTQLLPIAIPSIEYLEPPFPFEVEKSWKDDALAAIRIRLTSQSDKLPLGRMQFDQLRFYLGGSTALGTELFESFFRDALGVSIYTPKNLRGTSLPSDSIRHVGFGDHQGLFSDDPRTIKAYRLLWEFFAAPEKFRFVDLAIQSVWAKSTEDADVVDLVIPLRRTNSTIQRDLRNDTIRLGCTPIVNLFEHRAESIRLSKNKTEHRVIPSARKTEGMEVISIDSVSASNPGGQEKRRFLPFFMPNHVGDGNAEPMYWHASRRRLLTEAAEGDRGTDVFLTLVDLQSNPLSMEEWTLHVVTTCCNRDMVSRLPFGRGRPRLTLRDAGGAVQTEMLIPPTPTRRPTQSDDYYWKLISHLSLNHLAIGNESNGAETLREILTLYNPSEEDANKRAIQSIEKVTYQRGVARLRTPAGSGFCRGLEVEILVDEERLVGMGPYLFATILDHFFSLYATVNSFTRLTVKTKSSNTPLYVGKARSGDRYLL